MSMNAMLHVGGTSTHHIIHSSDAFFYFFHYQTVLRLYGGGDDQQVHKVTVSIARGQKECAGSGVRGFIVCIVLRCRID